MPTTPINPQPRITAERRVSVWAYVLRCVEKDAPDERTRDAKLLVTKQMRTATDEVGRQP